MFMYALTAAASLRVTFLWTISRLLIRSNCFHLTHIVKMKPPLPVLFNTAADRGIRIAILPSYKERKEKMKSGKKAQWEVTEITILL